MSDGYFIRKDDKTTCGGVVLDADTRVMIFGMTQSCEGDRVTCGVDGKTYRIEGGVSHVISHGRRVAGTLDSVSGCPCKAQLIASVHTATYQNQHQASPASHRQSWAAPTGRAADSSPSSPAPFTPAGEHERAYTGELSGDEVEEEEEEVEQEQLITLRLGVFFDGTGNNQANSESVAGCMARDVGLQDMAEELQRFCATHGYGTDGSTPDNSYGNDTSNVARLYDLYTDQADVTIASDAEEAALKVYLEGIGTVSGGEDARYGLATGRWSTGVLARVEQSPESILKRVRFFISNNPDVKIRSIEVDIFGFSRGAAAARHFANDLRKGAHSLLAKAVPAGSSMLADGFAWRMQRDITLNFIGLFDTVPGIVSPLVGNFSPGNTRVSGLNLALPAHAARKVVQFVARDEHRQNFALTLTDNDIVLPGAHSDIGGGYLPRSRERLIISKPLSSLERLDTPNERSSAYFQSRRTADPWLDRLTEHGVELKPEIWSVNQPRGRHELYPEKRVYVAARIDREVDGDLSKVYLRIMRELGLRNGVPFKQIPDAPRLALPQELMVISEKLQAYALGESGALALTSAEESLLFRRYIHFSANWNALMNFKSSDLNVLFINRPTDNRKRVMHANK